MLSSYEGTVLFVSHDRFFIDRVATRVWEADAGKLLTYLGNYTEALRQKARRHLPASPEPKPELPRAVQRETPPERRKRSTGDSETRLQRRLTGAERDISRLEGRLNELSDTIAIAGIDGDHEALARLSEEYAAAERELDDAYALWEEVNTHLESLVTTTAG
jgi:ATP-binding cassette subfamily F protein 3